LVFFELPLADFGVLLGVIEFSFSGRLGVFESCSLLGDSFVLEATEAGVGGVLVK